MENDGRARKAMTDELETAMTDEPEAEWRPVGPLWSEGESVMAVSSESVIAFLASPSFSTAWTSCQASFAIHYNF